MTKRQKDRIARLMPNGEPRWVRIYDNGGETADRYTVVFSGRYPKTGREFVYLGMSGAPYHPQGVCLHGFSKFQAVDVDKHGFAPALGRKCHLGRRIDWTELPEDCRKAALETYRDLWDIPEPDKSS